LLTDPIPDYIAKLMEIEGIFDNVPKFYLDIESSFDDIASSPTKNIEEKSITLKL